MKRKFLSMALAAVLATTMLNVPVTAYADAGKATLEDMADTEIKRLRKRFVASLVFLIPLRNSRLMLLLRKLEMSTKLFILLKLAGEL